MKHSFANSGLTLLLVLTCNLNAEIYWDAETNSVRSTGKDAEPARIYFTLERKRKEQLAKIERLKEEAASLRAQAKTLAPTLNKMATESRREIESSISKSFIDQTSPYIVVIEGDKGSGTGFLTEEGGQVWVYTAAHVLSGNSKLAVRDSQGRRYSKFDFMESAEGVDLVRLRPTNQELKGLKLASKKESPALGDTVVAVGNSLGTGSLSLEAGIVNGFDETMWEVSNDIIPGNSGGPVLDLKTGKVIGIVTHLTMKRHQRQPGQPIQLDIKRFAARLDRDWQWTKMPVTRFVKEWQYIEKMETDSMIAWATITTLMNKYEAPHSPRNRQTVDEIKAQRAMLKAAEDIMKEHASHFSVQRTQHWLKSYQADYFTKDAINKAKIVIANNINGIRLNGKEPKPEHFSWFHRDSYDEVLGWRKEVFDRGKETSE